MKKLLLALCFIFGALASFAGAPVVEKHVGVVEDGYNFWLSSPDSIVTEPKPLIIFLHGRSLSGTDLNKVKKYGTLDAVLKGRDIDAFVLAPQVKSGPWVPSKVMDVLEYVLNRYEVDESRIYVVGMSLGGYGTIDFAATYPDIVAAAVGMCGGATVKDFTGLNEVPMWIIHGTADERVPVKESDKVVEAVKNVDPDTPRLAYDRTPGINHGRLARVFYLPELYDWLFQHSLDDEGRPIQQPVKIDEDILGRAYQGINSRK